MNIYEQLVAVRGDLQRQGANGRTIDLVDSMIKVAEDQRNSGLSFTRLQVLRRMQQLPQALNDEQVRLDLLALEGDLEDAAAQRSTEPAAYEEAPQRPKLKKYYKKK